MSNEKEAGQTPAIMALPSQTEMANQALSRAFVWRFREYTEPAMRLHERDKDGILDAAIMDLLTRHEQGLRQIADRWEELVKDFWNARPMPPVIFKTVPPAGILVTREQLEAIQWAVPCGEDGNLRACPVCDATQNHDEDCWIGKALKS